MQDRRIDDAEIAKRAYALWEEEGRPEGRHQEHWSRAQSELGTTAAQEAPDELDTAAPQAPYGSGTIDPPQAADELTGATPSAASEAPEAQKTPRRKVSIDNPATEAAAPKRAARRKAPSAAI